MKSDLRSTSQLGIGTLDRRKESNRESEEETSMFEMRNAYACVWWGIDPL